LPQGNRFRIIDTIHPNRNCRFFPIRARYKGRFESKVITSRKGETALDLSQQWWITWPTGLGCEKDIGRILVVTIFWEEISEYSDTITVEKNKKGCCETKSTVEHLG
jgi:hypothetical protein